MSGPPRVDIDMAMWPWLDDGMKTMAAGKFKDLCLKTLDEVAATKSTIVITKRGRPVAKLVPCGPEATSRRRGLAGSILKETGDPFGTGERWDADPS